MEYQPSSTFPVSTATPIVSKLADRHIYDQLFSLCQIIPDRLSGSVFRRNKILVR